MLGIFAYMSWTKVGQKIDNVRRSIRQFKKLIEEDRPKHPRNFAFFEPIALRYAVRYNFTDVFDFMLTVKEMDFHVRTQTNKNMLHFAVDSFSESHVTYVLVTLLNKGLDVNVVCNEGTTPLTRSCNRHTQTIIPLLLYYGARATSLHVVLAIDEKLQAEIIEQLYEHAFDDLEPFSIPLDRMYDLYDSYPELYIRIVAKVSIVTMSAKFYFFKKLPFAQFQQLLPKIPIEDLNTNNLILEGFDEMLKNDDADKYIEFFKHHLYKLPELDLSFYLSLKTYQQIAVIFSMLLSWGVDVRVDFNKLYQLHGFSELFENLIYMGVEHMKGYWHPSTQLFAPALYNAVFSVAPYQPPSDIVPVDADQYFAPKNKVPSLLQCGRDAARTHIARRYKIKRPGQLLKVYKALLPRPVEDILTFKKALY